MYERISNAKAPSNTAKPKQKGIKRQFRPDSYPNVQPNAFASERAKTVLRMSQTQDLTFG
jgi:hypothetical protein